jgi:transcriptional regulator with XRE-family HTH domain
MTELRAKGMSYVEIGRALGMSRQAVRRALEPRPSTRSFRICCRLCERDINCSGAVPRDDRDVLCLTCLANRPDLGFGEHLKAFRLAAGLKVRALAEHVGVRPSVISSYEHGRTGTPTWKLLMRLLQALHVQLVMSLPGGSELSGSPADASAIAQASALGEAQTEASARSVNPSQRGGG